MKKFDHWFFKGPIVFIAFVTLLFMIKYSTREEYSIPKTENIKPVGQKSDFNLSLDKYALQAIYEHEEFEDRGISFEEFAQDMQNPKMRRDVYERGGFEDRGMLYEEYEIALGIKQSIDEEKSQSTLKKNRINPSNITEKTEILEGIFLVNIGGEWRGRAGGGTRGGKWGLIDNEGNLITPLKYDYIAPYNGLDVMFYYKNENPDGGYEYCGLMDRKGRIITEPVFEGRENYIISEGYVWLKKDGYWGMLNPFTGEVIIDFNYLYGKDRWSSEDRWISPYVSEGYVNLGNLLLDISNKDVIPFTGYTIMSNVKCNSMILYDRASAISHYIYNIKGRKAVFNAKWVSPFGKCLYVFSVNGDASPCENFVEGKDFGVVDYNGEVLIEPKNYNAFVYDYDNDWILAYKEYKKGCGNYSDCFCAFEGEHDIFNVSTMSWSK